MKALFLDCGMGAAGDMLQGALVSLLSKEEQESFINEINSVGIDGVKVTLKDDVKCGVTGKHISVTINGEEEHSEDVHEHHHEHEDHHDHEHHHHHEQHHHDHEHDHHHDHDHSHEHHHHASLGDIKHMIEHLNVSDDIKKHVIEVYEIIAQAESKVHGKEVSMVHFHEVGMKDALADILGVVMLIDKLSVDRIIVSPVNTGFGKVKCAHGILPVPAPATAEILKGIPVYAGRFEGEMCTPTGAALLKHFADLYSNQPLMIIENSGYGCGNKEFEAANVVKAVIGEIVENNCVDSNAELSENLRDSIMELRCNVDDMTGEELAYAVEVLFENGVKDAFVTPVVMKKGRSGFLLTVLCAENDKTKIAEVIFKHTSTIGIREYRLNRMVLDRKESVVDTEFGKVNIKESFGYGVKKIKPEFEDLKRISDEKNVSINEVKLAVNEALKNR